MAVEKIPNGEFAGDAGAASIYDTFEVVQRNFDYLDRRITNYPAPERGLEGLQGDQGPQGPSGTLAIGEVYTLAPGSQAYITNIGSPQNGIWEIGIPQGLPGAIGDKGPTGDKGLTGATGPVGNKGPTGDKGQVGDKGPNGDQGTQGVQGPVGDTGVTGTKGPVGDKGPLGDKGALGDKGPAGDKGPVGDKGLPGDKGPTGDAGPQGPAGDVGVAAKPSKIEAFDSSGTWVKDPLAKRVDVFAQAPGGGGSSGARQANGAASRGGMGGGPGGATQASFAAEDLPSTVAVTIGAPGQGGVSVLTNSTAGNAGADGGNCEFSTLLVVGGSGASATAAGAGGSGVLNGPTGGSTNTTGGTASSNGSTILRATPGGPAAGQTATPGNYNGGLYPVPAKGLDPAIVGTVGVGATKTDATGPTAVQALYYRTMGAGGPGGWSNSDGTAGPGANASVGGGGGGGGGSLNGNPSGRGGNGGPGRVVVVTHF